MENEKKITKIPELSSAIDADTNALQHNEELNAELQSIISYYFNKCNLARTEGPDELYRFCTFAHIKNEISELNTTNIYKRLSSLNYCVYTLPHYEIISQAICQYLPFVIDRSEVGPLIAELNSRIVCYPGKQKYLATQEDIEKCEKTFLKLTEQAMKENGSFLPGLSPRDLFIDYCYKDEMLMKFLINTELIKIYDVRYNTKMTFPKTAFIEHVINPYNQSCYIYVSLPRIAKIALIMERSYCLLYSYLFNSEFANYIWGYSMKFARIVDYGSLDGRWNNLPINLSCEYGTEFTMAANSKRGIDFVKSSSVTVATLKNAAW